MIHRHYFEAIFEAIFEVIFEATIEVIFEAPFEVIFEATFEDFFEAAFAVIFEATLEAIFDAAFEVILEAAFGVIFEAASGVIFESTLELMVFAASYATTGPPVFTYSTLRHAKPVITTSRTIKARMTTHSTLMTIHMNTMQSREAVRQTNRHVKVFIAGALSACSAALAFIALQVFMAAVFATKVFELVFTVIRCAWRLTQERANTITFTSKRRTYPSKLTMTALMMEQSFIA